MKTRIEQEKTDVAEKPMLFSTPMVKAILERGKTQTRRIVKLTDSGRVKAVGSHMNWHLDDPNCLKACPYGQIGDRLWVKETFLNNALSGYPPVYFYRADSSDKPSDRAWKPSIFMPRKASRITLEITGVRVEQLQEISHRDALAEGVQYDVSKEDGDPVTRFRMLWESINGAGSWSLNPYVWVIEFRKL